MACLLLTHYAHLFLFFLWHWEHDMYTVSSIKLLSYSAVTEDISRDTILLLPLQGAPKIAQEMAEKGHVSEVLNM